VARRRRLCRSFWWELLPESRLSLPSKRNERSHPLRDGFFFEARSFRVRYSGLSGFFCLGLGDTNGDACTLQRDGGVDGIYIGADDSHEVGVGRYDVDLAGGSAGGDGDVVRVTVFGRGSCVRVDAERKWDRSHDGVGAEIDYGDGAGGGGGCDRSAWGGAGQIWIAAVDDVSAAVGGVLQCAYLDGVYTDWNGCRNGAEADRVDGVIEVAVWVANLGGRRTERDADDTERAWIDAIAGICHEQLIADRGEVCPERVDGRGVGACRGDAECDWVGGAWGGCGNYIERVGLDIDDRDGTVALVEDEGTSGVGGHDTVNGVQTDGKSCGVDGVARRLDRGDLTYAAATDGRTDGVDAWRTGDTDGVDGSEGRRSRAGSNWWSGIELLAQGEGRAGELRDYALAEVDGGVGDVGAESGGKDRDRVGAGEQCGLEDLTGEEGGVDVEAGKGVVAVKREAEARSGGGGGAAIEDEVIGVHSHVGRDEDCVSREVDEGQQAWGGIGRCAGAGDRDGELLRLGGGADRVDGADDRAVVVAATADQSQARCQNGEDRCGAECRPEGLGSRPNRAPV